jgi:hypothetical protein
VEPYPFGIAKLLKSDENGDMQLQWLCNPSSSTGGVYEPGWKASTAANARAYYADHATRSHHVPYTTDMDGLHMNQRDVLIHGFELTPGGRLPAPLLRAIARHPYVWWDPLATKKDAAIQAAACVEEVSRRIYRNKGVPDRRRARERPRESASQRTDKRRRTRNGV